jgi:hypothetical protein
MDGEFFHGAYCPRDGSCTDASLEAARLVAAIRAEGAVPSLEELARRGFSGPFDDVVVAQFASRHDAPAYFWPDSRGRDAGEPRLGR